MHDLSVVIISPIRGWGWLISEGGLVIRRTAFVTLSNVEFLCLSGFVLLSNDNEHFQIYFKIFEDSGDL